MIKFNSTAIYNRAVDRLQQDPNWKAIINDSVVSAIIKSNAEINAETARYAEYLFRESRWDTAQNNSSILAMANMLGYQPKRKISAAGKLYVSIDPKTHLVGKTKSIDSFLKLDSEDESIRTTTRASLDWIPSNYFNVELNSSCTVTDAEGNNYIITKPTYLKQNSCFTTVEIIQGIKKSVFLDINTIRTTATFSKLDPYIYIPVKITNCENASTLASGQFLKVFIAKPNGDNDIEYEEYRIVNNLLLSSSADKDVEFYNDLYNQNLFYLKFNNDLYNGLTLDLSQNTSILGIRIDYVESTGSIGNIEELYKTFTITDAHSDNKANTVKLYGINYTPVNGGKDEENIADIKKNAIKFYTKYYTIGTKEAYKKIIEDTEFHISITNNSGETKNVTVIPKKVQVFGGYLDSEISTRQLVTYVSFIGSELEDLSNSIDLNPYQGVDDALNFYLEKLKSPQDIVRFYPPNYTCFALGLDCTIANDTNMESANISSDISNFIESLWGPNSDNLDFNNSFLPSQLENKIMSKFPEVDSISLEVEAVSKLNWSIAEIKAPQGNDAEKIHTCRIPFDFSSVFVDKELERGFKDYSVGSKYVARIDILYKKPSILTNTPSLHKTIIFAENNININPRSTSGFYCINDTDGIWVRPETNVDFITYSEDYNEVGGVDKLEESYQIDFERKVFNDRNFLLLQNNIKNNKITLKTSATSKGALDNYLFYFSGNYDTSSNNIGYGWFEFSFDEIYNVLSTFAIYDSSIAEKLKECPLALLKCGTTDIEVFNKFKDLANTYIDFYVSFRPIKSNLNLQATSKVNNKNNDSKVDVLYIDSYDSITVDSIRGANVTNLSADKKARFINVECSYLGVN